MRHKNAKSKTRKKRISIQSTHLPKMQIKNSPPCRRREIQKIHKFKKQRIQSQNETRRKQLRRFNPKRNSLIHETTRKNHEQHGQPLFRGHE